MCAHVRLVNLFVKYFRITRKLLLPITHGHTLTNSRIPFRRSKKSSSLCFLFHVFINIFACCDTGNSYIRATKPTKLNRMRKPDVFLKLNG